MLKYFLGKPSKILDRLLESDAPKTPQDARVIMEKCDPIFNYLPPSVGSYHKAVKVNENNTTDIVVPKGTGPFPIFYLIHGGGWVGGNPKQYRKLSRRFAQAGFLVFTVDYRLAPEFPFPIGFNDCIDTYHWIVKNSHRWGGDTNRIAIGGDSAGGNISAAVAAELSGIEVPPKAAVLMYGAYDMHQLFHREDKTEKDKRINDGNRMTISAYCKDDDTLKNDPRMSPILAADKFPPSHILVGEADPLIEQSDALTSRLQEAGVDYEYHIDPGMPHAYLQIEFFPGSKRAQKRIFEFLRKKLDMT